MILSKMLRISSILSKLENVKGGINTALLTLPLSTQQEFIELCPEIDIVKKRLFKKDEIIKQPQTQLLIEDYNNEYKEYFKLLQSEKTTNNEIKITLTNHEILTQTINDLAKIGHDISLISLTDAYFIMKAESRDKIWEGLHNLMNSMQDKVKRIVIKNFIKRSSRDNYIANKKWLQFYAG